MRRDSKTLALTIAIFGVALYLQGCSTLQDANDSAATAPAEVQVRTVVKEVPSAPTTEAVSILRELDAAGCDPKGIDVTRNKARKNHVGIRVTCK